VALVTIVEPRAAAYPDRATQVAAEGSAPYPADPDRLCASPRLPSSWPEGRSDSRIVAALNASPAVVYWVRKQPVEEPSRR
jgi:hypothetical protein